MIIIDIPEKKKTFSLPEEMSECDGRQYIDMSKLIYMFNVGEINYSDFCKLAVYALLGLKQSNKKGKTDQKWENVFTLSEKVISFFDIEEKDGKKILSLKNYDITNKLPVYKLFRSWYGPEDGFMNISYGQYSDGLEEYISYSQTGDLHALRLLFSIFYRKKNLFTGKLEKYDFDKAKKRADGIFMHCDIRYLYGFYLLFEAFQKYTSSGSITVFGEEIDLSIIYEDAGVKSAVPGIGIHGIVNDLAETGIFGNADGVRETNFWRVALQLYYVKKKSIDQLNESKRNGSA